MLLQTQTELERDVMKACIWLSSPFSVFRVLRGGGQSNAVEVRSPGIPARQGHFSARRYSSNGLPPHPRATPITARVNKDVFYHPS